MACAAKMRSYRTMRTPALVPSYAAWSLVHGYTSLALEGAIDDETPDPLTSDLLPAMLRLLDLAPDHP